MTFSALDLTRCNKIAYIASVCLALFANSPPAQGIESTQQAKPLGAGTVATRNTVEAISGAISGAFLGGLNVFRFQIGENNELPERGMSASASESAWSIWGTPVYSTVNNRIEPLLNEGSVSLLLVGLEYAYDEFTVFGLSVTRDWARLTSLERLPPAVDRQSSVRGLGYTFAPYFAHQLGPDWLIDFSVGKGVNELESRQADLSLAKPKDKRSFVSLGATYLKPLTNGNMFTGRITVSRTKDSIDDFVSTLPSGSANAVPGSEATLSQLKIGGQLSKQMGRVSPFVGVYGITNDFTVTTNAPVKPREYSEVLQWVAGINASSGPIYGALAFLRERDRNQARIYVGVRY